MNIQKIKGRMAELGFSQEYVAEKLNISMRAMSNKLRGLNDFKSAEIVQLSYVLKIADIRDFFLDLYSNI